MKIAAIELFQHDLPYPGGVYRLSGGRTYTSFDSAVVRITADDGTVGWGESTPFGANYIAAHARGVRAGIAELAPVMLGRDPRKVERNYDLMDETLTGHNHAKTPIDVACWDLFGKSVELPVCELLGGSTGTPMATISSIHSGDPEDMRRRVAEHREAGFRGHSVKIGSLDSEGGPVLDATRIEACLADREPGEFFIVDANGGMLPEMVLRLFNALPPGLDFVLEAPCATWQQTMSVRERSPYPIVIDELGQTDADVMFAAANRIADGAGLKISKAGGLTPARRQRDILRSAGMTISVQETAGSAIAYAAILQLGATVPEQYLRCVLDTASTYGAGAGSLDLRFEDGGVIPAQLPGLGLTVDESVLGEAVATWHV